MQRSIPRPAEDCASHKHNGRPDLAGDHLREGVSTGISDSTKSRGLKQYWKAG